MQPAITDNEPCVPLHTHLLAAAFQPYLDALYSASEMQNRMWMLLW